MRTRVYLVYPIENLLKNDVYLSFDMQQIYCIVFSLLVHTFQRLKETSQDVIILIRADLLHCKGMELISFYYFLKGMCTKERREQNAIHPFSVCNIAFLIHVLFFYLDQ